MFMSSIAIVAVGSVFKRLYRGSWRRPALGSLLLGCLDSPPPPSNKKMASRATHYFSLIFRSDFGSLQTPPLDPELLQVSDTTSSELDLSLYAFPQVIAATRCVY
jgi:gluconate kinase